MPALTHRAAMLAAAALAAARSGRTAAVRSRLAVAPFGPSSKAIAHGLLARPGMLLADRCAVLSGGRLPRTGPAPAMPDGLEGACSEDTAA